jgi:hypothetical protein
MYECQYCDKSYPYKYNLNRHLKTCGNKITLVDKMLQYDNKMLQYDDNIQKLFNKNSQLEAQNKYMIDLINSQPNQKTPDYYLNYFNNNEYVLSDYEDKHTIYVGYIGSRGACLESTKSCGVYNGEHIFKFGRSYRVIKRCFDEHKNFFGTFEFVRIFECIDKEYIEQKFKNNLKELKLNRKLIINNQNTTELFTVTGAITLDHLLDSLNGSIADRNKSYFQIE